jgi:hypothetical protein
VRHTTRKTHEEEAVTFSNTYSLAVLERFRRSILAVFVSSKIKCIFRYVKLTRQNCRRHDCLLQPHSSSYEREIYITTYSKSRGNAYEN